VKFDISPLAARYVPLRDEKLLYVSMNVAASTPPMAGLPIVLESGICLRSLVLVRATNLMN